MLDDLQSLINRLKRNSSVVGIVRYGGRKLNDMSLGGDFDIFVFVEQRLPAVESLHFFVQDIPVDLNIRTLDDLRRDVPLIPFDITLMTVELLYDPHGELQPLLTDVKNRWHTQTENLDEHTLAFMRFAHRHTLDKVRHRLETEPLLSELLLSSNVYWLMQNYFRVRGMPFPGEKDTLIWLKVHDTKVYQLINQFFITNNLGQKMEISEALSEIVLRPIGGLWHKSEILALGLDENVENLQEQGREAFQKLLGEAHI
jgi:hypothetical protein